MIIFLFKILPLEKAHVSVDGENGEAIVATEMQMVKAGFQICEKCLHGMGLMKEKEKWKWKVISV